MALPPTIHIPKNDLNPSYTFTLKKAGSAVDLSSGVTNVTFSMRQEGQTAKKIDGRALTVTDAANGEVRLDWSSGDTDTPGAFIGRVTVNWSGSKPESFPRKDLLHVVVHDPV